MELTHFPRSFPRVRIPSSLLGPVASTRFLSGLGIQSDPGAHHWHQVSMFWKYGLSQRTLEAMLSALRTSRSPAGEGVVKQRCITVTRTNALGPGFLVTPAIATFRTTPALIAGSFKFSPCLREWGQETRLVYERGKLGWGGEGKISEKRCMKMPTGSLFVCWFKNLEDGKINVCYLVVVGC